MVYSSITCGFIGGYRVVDVVEDTADWASDQITDGFEWASDQLDSVIDLFDIGGPDHKTTDILDDLDKLDDEPKKG